MKDKKTLSYLELSCTFIESYDESCKGFKCSGIYSSLAAVAKLTLHEKRERESLIE